MNTLRQKLIALTVAIYSTSVSAFADNVYVSANFETLRVAIAPYQSSSTYIDAYNELGLMVGSLYADVYGNDGSGGPFASVQFSTNLQPGRYSFAIHGDDGYTYWTNWVDVPAGGSSYYASFNLEAFPNSTAPADQTVNGNLLVLGSIELRGTLFNMGTNPSNSDEPAFSLRIDNGSSQRNISAYYAPTWTWENQVGTGMYLSMNGGNASLYVNGHPVAFADSPIFTNPGTFTLVTANQLRSGGGTATGTNSVGLAGGSASGSNTIAGGASATAGGSNSIALGSGAQAGGFSSIAIGSGAQANGIGLLSRLAIGMGTNSSGMGSVALGRSAIASGDHSISVGIDSAAYGGLSTVFGRSNTARTSTTPASESSGALALGDYNSASGVSSIAVGRNNTASGFGASVFGYVSTSSGYLSNAFGFRNIAQGPFQTVVGSYNIPQGDINSTSPADSDLLFILGNGTGSAALSNALTVRKDSGTAIGKGVESGQEAQVVVGKYNKASTNALFAVGNGTDDDGSGPNLPIRDNALEVRKDGSVHAKILRVPESGDLSMGTFKSGPEPFAP